MSPSRSDTGTDVTADPLRPGDHADSESATEITQPALGITGWLRWAWRQLTSMRTALVLLLFLAIAAVPGSLFPQRSADPNGVIQWERDNPDVFPSPMRSACSTCTCRRGSPRSICCCSPP
jgi:cytochrome c biogenesis protein